MTLFVAALPTPEAPARILCPVVTESRMAVAPSHSHIHRLMEKHTSADPFISFEFFPPRTPEGLENLYAKLHKFKAQSECDDAQPL
jgi:hypothetical protein